MRLLRRTRWVSELRQLLAIGRCVWEGLWNLFLAKRNQNQSWRCDSDQARHSWLIFDRVAFKKLEGLCVGILKFFPIWNVTGFNAFLDRSHDLELFCHLNFFHKSKIDRYMALFSCWASRSQTHPNSGRYSDMLGKYDVRYQAGHVATQNKNGFCPT